MSILGPSSMAINVAASIAGTMRNPVESDRIKADQAQQKMHADVVQLSTPDLADDLESDLSHGQVADRDADGRLPWSFGEQRQEDDADQSSTEPASGRTPDETDERGQTLDVNA